MKPNPTNADLMAELAAVKLDLATKDEQLRNMAEALEDALQNTSDASDTILKAGSYMELVS